MQASGHDKLVLPVRARLVWTAALLLALATAALRFADTGSTLLHLRPLVGSATAPTAAAAWLDEQFAGTNLAVRLGAALLAGACASLLFLLIEQSLRRFALLRNEPAAFLAAVLFAMAPIGAASVRCCSGPALLVVLSLIWLACYLSSGKFWLIGTGLTLGLFWIHPLAAVLAVWPAYFLMAERKPLAAGVIIIAVAAQVLCCDGIAAQTPGLADRFGASVDALLAAPALAVNSSVRPLLATGGDWISGRMPVAQGAAMWCLLLGLGCMIGRFRVALPLAALTLSTGLGAAALIPGWVPGESTVIWVLTAPVAMFVALILAPVAGQWWREICAGVCLGLIAVSVTAETRIRGPQLVTRRLAVGIPVRELSANSFAPDLETDPVRLVVYMEEMLSLNGRLDPQLLQCGVNAVRLLSGPGPCALQPTIALERAQALMEAPGATPLDAAPEDAWIFAVLPELRTALDRILARLDESGPVAAYQSSADELVDLLPRLSEVVAAHSQHAKVVQFVDLLVATARTLAGWATRTGDLRVSIALRELIVDAVGRDSRALAILGRELVEAGRVSEALPLLEAALKGIGNRDILWCVTRGALGRALVAQGDVDAGLEHMDAAWAGIGAGTPGAGQRLSQSTDSNGIDYWLVVELLLARCEATHQVRPARWVQASTDLQRILSEAQAQGLERLPALLAEGRMALLVGDKPKALRVLRSARALRSKDLLERGDGPHGRLDFPRFRVRVLESLLECLDREEDAPERNEVAAELRQLRR